MKSNVIRIVLRIALFCLIAFTAHGSANAQSGCIDSPENPTALLAVAGSAGACIAALRRRGR